MSNVERFLALLFHEVPWIGYSIMFVILLFITFIIAHAMGRRMANKNNMKDWPAKHREEVEEARRAVKTLKGRNMRLTVKNNNLVGLIKTMGIMAGNIASVAAGRNAEKVEKVED